MTSTEEPCELGARDIEVLRLLDAALADPSIHTDMRLHIGHEITELLRATHHDVYGAAEGRAIHEQELAAHGERLGDLVRAVLVDPNVHTEARMRIQREIPELLRAARAG
jgi:hypothetical protein